jgi:diguanylate cyclase (GGDEF)-like protein
VDYVTKPFNASILLARVNTHLTLHQQAKKLQSLAERDGLTLIANRRRFDEFLQYEWRRSQRAEKPISLIMLDIDYFKPYNDTYGHLQGDETLKRVAEVIQKMAQRPSDLAARYGGEEFSLILGETELEAAQHIAEKIRATVQELAIPHSASEVIPFVPVSLGVSSTTIPHGEHFDVERLIRAADERLYKAKQNGRNQIQATSLESE